MRILMAFIFLPFFQQVQSQPAFQLAAPLLKYQSAFFSGSTLLEVNFNQPGSMVHFTLNGNEPTETDPEYLSPIKISKATVVKVKAFSNDFLPSETVSVHFMQDGKAISQMEFSTPDKSYTSSNPAMLYDNIGGITNLKSGTWLGYKSDTVTITIQLKKKEKLKTILVDLLQDEGSWIFAPEHGFVYCYDEKSAAFVLSGEHINKQQIPSPKQTVMLDIPINPTFKTNQLKLVLVPFNKIPDWHNGKGNHSWLFIDEIKVY
ncbi:MAG: chitobiase/beta-hexosaminidase C-terminal domain-containing protein [Ferruginibacter sp.]